MKALLAASVRARSLVSIELERATRTRTTWTVAGAMLLVAALVAYGATQATPPGGVATAAGQQVREAFRGVATLRVFVLLLGVLCVTSQFHHGDIVWRYLADPSRTLFVVAKAASCAVVGACLGVAVLQLGAVVTLVGAGPAGLGLSSGEVGQTVFGTVLGMALAGVLGVGIGAAVRSQTAAVVGTLVAVLLVEPLLTAVSPTLGALLPSAAAAAAAGSTASLSWAAGVALSIGYAAAAATAGVLLCRRVDV